MRAPRRTTLILLLIGMPAVAAVYAVELALTYPRFLTERHLLPANPATFDPIAATKRIRESGTVVYPITTDALYRLAKPVTPNGQGVYPLAAKSHSTIVLCNETGDDVLFQSDRHGFKNPDSVWESKPSVALVGDSFTQGECVGPLSDIASHLRDKLVTLNAGVSGSGPLRELGILREYVAPLRPRIVFWLFFEGNDVEDIAAEMPTAAGQYLQRDYSQNLAARQRDVDAIIDHGVFDAVRLRFDDERHPSPLDFILLRRLRRLIMPRAHPVSPNPDKGLRTLDSVLAIANTTVAAWGGKLSLVYLPDRRRFAGRDHTTIGAGYELDVIHGHVLSTAGRLGLSVIDASLLFSRNDDPLELWTSARSHYDSAGYALVGAALLKSALSDSALPGKSGQTSRKILLSKLSKIP